MPYFLKMDPCNLDLLFHLIFASLQCILTQPCELRIFVLSKNLPTQMYFTSALRRQKKFFGKKYITMFYNDCDIL